MQASTIDSAVTTQPKPSTPRKRVQGGLLDPQMLLRSTPDALRKLDPRTLWRTPVRFIVEIGAFMGRVVPGLCGGARVRPRHGRRRSIPGSGVDQDHRTDQ
jgi:hypothetical protein